MRYGIDPIGDLRTPMGSIPKVTLGHLWDRSHKCSEDTYGINPIAHFLLPMGLFSQIETFYGINPIGDLKTPMGLIP